MIAEFFNAPINSLDYTSLVIYAVLVLLVTFLSGIWTYFLLKRVLEFIQREINEI